MANASQTVRRQELPARVREYMHDGRRYRITAHVRYDDRCGNGHNTFSITGTIDVRSLGGWRDHSGGCIHDDIAEHFPELAPLIPWHLFSADDGAHYMANAVYFAGDRDCWGLRATVTYRYVPWCSVGEGKTRELDKARAAAVWPDATDEELCQEPDALRAALRARHPALLAQFRVAMESLGFTY